MKVKRLNVEIAQRKLSDLCCGEGGIRTHGGASPTTVFETVPFGHSGTSPIEGWLLTASAQIIAQLPLNFH